MNPDDAWNRPYQKIAAVEEQQEANHLLTAYIALYKKKFRGEPIFDVSKIHFKHIKDIRNGAGEKAHAILNHYFSMKDEWFIKQAYSLDCLAKNLQKIGADYSRRTTEHKDEGRMHVVMGCDSCWKEMNFICDIHFDVCNKVVRCEDCIQNNVPPKKVTKAERRATILKLGAAFPDIPY